MSEPGAFVDLGSVADIADGELVGAVLPSGTPVCLYRLGEWVGAVSDRCTHAEYAMSDGVLHADGTLECIWHGARFDCLTGAVRRHPATEPLPVFDVKVEAGRVLVADRPAAVPGRVDSR